MISFDIYILEFVGKNWLSLGLLMILLNGLCEIIPGTWDNKLVDIFKRMITFTRQKQGNGSGEGELKT